MRQKTFMPVQPNMSSKYRDKAGRRTNQSKNSPSNRLRAASGAAWGLLIHFQVSELSNLISVFVNVNLKKILGAQSEFFECQIFTINKAPIRAFIQFFRIKPVRIFFK